MADAKAPPARPLSPHLQIYRWTWTMAMSVAHRVTGCALYFGTVLVAIWLAALASGPHAYDRVSWFFGSPLGLLIMFGYTWVLMHHLLGGIRHLVWDTGYGFDYENRMRMARMTLVLSPILTVALWVIALVMR
ncbi:succinate dehydrogenase, cytochrome b556 subunit [Enterovirga sp.]|uniref:succinate dehydrogenase, cytochrome b556 subunit n=1 Tax=Enterovirga sp. TaxID=2026350 RepID=UPI002D152403|nr:succinate dehydrogenase, cytochrome b556 subunit [Enterovirga sp.]HMO29371.1 succinate dehydrogenase, cytochrome b556 subunit [Enterovirga sp.]